MEDLVASLCQLPFRARNAAPSRASLHLIGLHGQQSECRAAAGSCLALWLVDWLARWAPSPGGDMQTAPGGLAFSHVETEL
jgi:hypothetical protein